MTNSLNVRQQLTFFSNSPAATFNLGKRVGERLVAGSIIALIGELGCGKTLFTRGVCVGLGVPEKHVNSPTFILVNEYQGRLPVFHIDLYRLSSLTEEFEIGILDYLAKADEAVIVIEWAEKMLSLLPDSHLQVQFQVLSARRRQLVFIGFGERFDSLFRELGGK
jgi:tRNA threonylcarbamoyladenosine biosynthesis protein TsaE